MEHRRTRIRENLLLKIIAVLTAVVCFAVCFFSAALTVFCFQYNVYNDGGVKLMEKSVASRCETLFYRFSRSLWNAEPLEWAITQAPGESEKPEVIENETLSEHTELDSERIGLALFDSLRPENCDYVFTVHGADGQTVYSTLPMDPDALNAGYEPLQQDYSVSVIMTGTEKLNVYMEYSTIKEALEDASNFNRFSGVVTANVLFRNTDSHAGEGISVINTGEVCSFYEGEEKYATRNIGMCAVVESIIENSSAADFRFNNDEPVAWDDGSIEIIDGFDYTQAQFELLRDIYEEERINFVDIGDTGAWLPSWSNLSSEERDYIYNLVINREECYLSYTATGYYIPDVEETFYIDLYCSLNPTHGDSIQHTKDAVKFVTLYSYQFPVIAVASAFVLLLLVIYICVASGQRAGYEKAVPCWFDKIPLELVAAADVFAVFLLATLYVDLVYRYVFTNFATYRLLELAIMAAFPFGIGLAFVLSLMTLSTRVKAGVFLKYSFIGVGLWVLKLIGRLIKKLFKAIGYIFSKLPVAWKTALVIPAFALSNAVIIAACYEYQNGLPFFVLMGIWTAFFVLSMMWSIGFAKIKEYTGGIKDGDISKELDKQYMFGDLRRHAFDLESVDEGIKKAVDERMKSERFKTELIANVSHDLKTPLTSIVNYVDILSKDEIESPQAREHIDVLKRQAARMKKLIEDLVEVSKASSGNVSAHLERTDVNLLITQTSAEYAGRFNDCKLELVLSLPEKKQIAELDGRLMWRVLDNLYNNICKYSMPNTRVYVTAEDLNASVRVSFKNISRFRLDMTGEELMERFVRGDSSRNTEGSGLGLSIAKSFCDLQKVWFDITVDGDLFKVDLLITKLSDEEPEEQETSEYIEQEAALRREQRQRQPVDLPEAEPDEIEEETVPCETKITEALISAPKMAENSESAEPSTEDSGENGGEVKK